MRLRLVFDAAFPLDELQRCLFNVPDSLHYVSDLAVLLVQRFGLAPYARHGLILETRDSFALPLSQEIAVLRDEDVIWVKPRERKARWAPDAVGADGDAAVEREQAIGRKRARPSGEEAAARTATGDGGAATEPRKRQRVAASATAEQDPKAASKAQAAKGAAKRAAAGPKKGAGGGSGSSSGSEGSSSGSEEESSGEERRQRLAAVVQSALAPSAASPAKHAKPAPKPAAATATAPAPAAKPAAAASSSSEEESGSEESGSEESGSEESGSEEEAAAGRAAAAARGSGAAALQTPGPKQEPRPPRSSDKMSRSARRRANRRERKAATAGRAGPERGGPGAAGEAGEGGRKAENANKRRQQQRAVPLVPREHLSTDPRPALTLPAGAAGAARGHFRFDDDGATAGPAPASPAAPPPAPAAGGPRDGPMGPAGPSDLAAAAAAAGLASPAAGPSGDAPEAAEGGGLGGGRGRGRGWARGRTRHGGVFEFGWSGEGAAAPPPLAPDGPPAPERPRESGGRGEHGGRGRGRGRGRGGRRGWEEEGPGPEEAARVRQPPVPDLPPRDYERLPPLLQPPARGDVVAFRAVELNRRTWQPEVSPFRERVVCGVDVAADRIALRLTDREAALVRRWADDWARTKAEAAGRGEEVEEEEEGPPLEEYELKYSDLMDLRALPRP